MSLRITSFIHLFTWAKLVRCHCMFYACILHSYPHSHVTRCACNLHPPSSLRLCASPLVRSSTIGNNDVADRAQQQLPVCSIPGADERGRTCCGAGGIERNQCHRKWCYGTDRLGSFYHGSSTFIKWCILIWSLVFPHIRSFKYYLLKLIYRRGNKTVLNLIDRLTYGKQQKLVVIKKNKNCMQETNLQNKNICIFILNVRFCC